MSPVVDEDRMKPGHWFGLVLCVPFIVFTLLDGCVKDICPLTNSFH